MANKKLTPLQILYKEFKNAKTDKARNAARLAYESKLNEMYPPRSDRKSAVFNVPEYRNDDLMKNRVAGGQGHRYYNAGNKRRLTEDEVARRSPAVFVDPETGERYVRGFHYTQPENIESILEKGLVATLGPDAVNYQRRPGVWTSFGPGNPMGYDFVNNAYLGSKNYNMQPLEIRIPEEEWKAMPVDHTGQTGSDQVMVFRGSPSKPYGTVNIGGQEKTVAIPAEYISRFEFPKDYEEDYGLGKSLWGYTPLKRTLYKNDRDFFNILPDNIKREAKKSLGEGASYNAMNQYALDNHQRAVKNALVRDKDYMFAPRVEPGRTHSGNEKYDKEFDTAQGLQPNARKQWFYNTDFTTPYDAALAQERPAEVAEGSFVRGYPENPKNVLQEMTPAESRNTNRQLLNMAGDRTTIYDLSRGANLPTLYNNPVLQHYGVEWNLSKQKTEDYLKQAGVRTDLFETDYRFNGRNDPNYDYVRKYYWNWDDTDRYQNNRRENKRKLGRFNEQLYKDKYKARFDELDKASDADPENADLDAMDKVFVDFNAEKHTPEQMKAAREYVFGTPDKYGRSKFGQKDIGTAKMHARNDAALSDEFISKVESDALKLQEEHPSRSITDLEGIATKSEENQNLLDRLAEENYDEALQNIMENKRKSWRRQFTQDSLNRVYGHELGRKIGKYRASRGKPVNPKQQ